jgi:hypothetical protein
VLSVVPEGPVLAHPVHHDRPWPFFTVDDALPPAARAALLRLFDRDLPWQRHDSFYQCWIAVVTERVDRELLAGVLARMRELVDVPLADRITATVQRMQPGDQALPHTDRPLVGYEAVRLVVQLDDGWRDGDGGLFLVHPDPDGTEVAHVRAPRAGSAVGFVMTPASHHAVSPTRRTRRTVVFHLWHAGNTPEVARLVGELYDGASLAELPAALDRVAAEAEARLPEPTTLHAALAALALHRWGYADVAVVAGYRRALGEPVGDDEIGTESADEDDLAAALAGWVARLRLEDFDVAGWDALRRELAPRRPARHARLRAVWDACFPEAAAPSRPMAREPADLRARGA